MKVTAVPAAPRTWAVNPAAAYAIRDELRQGCLDVVREYAKGLASALGFGWDAHVTLTEDDGTVIWAGWLTGEDKPVPGPTDPEGQASAAYEAHARRRAALLGQPDQPVTPFTETDLVEQAAWHAAMVAGASVETQKLRATVAGLTSLRGRLAGIIDRYEQDSEQDAGDSTPVSLLGELAALLEATS